ncbi:MAG: hypothetical protein JO183_04595 [Ktedonobacteraceae bacterium]|nr:hypothetical protein [Ktedonobacteraceae bacterium]
MDEIRQASERAGEHIWLRYATQFSMGGRTYTVEMGIPMPIGVSAERREQLLREADAGMNQLSMHVEQRVTQMLQRAPQRATPAATSAAKSAASPVAPASPPAPEAILLSPPPAPQVREADYTIQREAIVPPTRPNVAASMPHMPVSGDTSNTLSLPQFIQHVKESMGLTPKQAMELLKVRTLTGVNLRDALEQLQSLVNHSTNVPAEKMQIEGQVATSTDQQSAASRSSASAKITSIDQHREVIGTVGDRHPTAFDEEIDVEEDQKEAELEDLDLLDELTPQQRIRAKELLDKFHESRGPTVVSSGRLQVLNNVIGTQISPEQLQQLAQGIWGVASIKKLKVDQVEVLISWAKEDDFLPDVEAVLAVLEEERYARGNR